FVLGGAVEDCVATINRKRRPAVLQIGLVLIVPEDNERLELGCSERLAELRGRGTRHVLPCDELCWRDHRGHSRIGFFKELGVGRGSALFVAVPDVLVGLEKAGQRLVRSEQHWGMGRSKPEYDLGHRGLLFRFVFRSSLNLRWQGPRRIGSRSY